MKPYALYIIYSCRTAVLHNYHEDWLPQCPVYEGKDGLNSVLRPESGSVFLQELCRAVAINHFHQKYFMGS
jgi:hypothetical protein